MISLTSVASCFFWTQFFSNVDDRCATFEIPCLDSEQFLGNLCPVQVKFLPTPIIFLDIDFLLDTGFKNFGVTTSTISIRMYLHHVQSFVVQWYVSLFHYVFLDCLAISVSSKTPWPWWGSLSVAEDVVLPTRSGHLRIRQVGSGCWKRLNSNVSRSIS